MALVFDSLGYSRRLRDAGLEPKIAEAAADAAREYIMLELVSKADLQLALDNLAMRLTIRLGSLIAIGIGVLAALIKLT